MYPVVLCCVSKSHRKSTHGAINHITFAKERHGCYALWLPSAALYKAMVCCYISSKELVSRAQCLQSARSCSVAIVCRCFSYMW